MNIEELDLDIKVYNRLKKNLPDVQTVNHLITEMYDQNGVEKISAPDMKKIEEALKAKGIFKYMRGDEVELDDIEPEPLTWDELRQYVGGLVVTDDSTQSHRWLHLCWIYDMDDECMSYLCRGNGYLNTRRASVENDNAQRVEFAGEMLRHEGHFFALKKYALRLDSLKLEDDEDDWPHGETFYFSDNPEVFGKELTYEELCTLPANTQVLIDDTFDSDDEDEDLAAELWRKDCQQYGEGVRLEYLDNDDCIQTQSITESMMTKRSTYYTRVFLKAGGAVAEAPKPKADIIPQEPAQVIVPDDYSRAVTLTRSIIANAQAAQQSMWEVCKGLNEMKERKLYKEIGYSTFEDYCEQEIGITRRQGQKYAAVAALDGKSTSDFEKIGIEKLYLLAKIDDDQREEIAQTVDLESTTVRELKAQIEAMKAESELDRKERDNANEAAQRWKNTAQSAQADNQRLEDQVQSLTDQVKEVEEAKERNRLTLRGIIDKKVELVHQLEAKVKELESRPIETAVVDHTEEIDGLKAEIESLKQQLAEKPDTQLALGVEPVYQTDSKALFKPYLTAAADAVNRLAEFIGQHQSDANYDFFMEKMHAAFAFADQKIQAMKG